METLFLWWKIEAIQFFREPKFLIPFLIPPIFLLLALVFGEENSSSLLHGSILLSGMSVSLASDRFSGDRERGLIDIYQLLPKNGLSWIWGRILAVVSIPLFFVILYLFLASLMASEVPWIWIFEALVWALVVIFGALAISMGNKEAKSSAQWGVLYLIVVLLFATFSEVWKFWSLVYLFLFGSGVFFFIRLRKFSVR
jgi:hypothetical protein